MKIPLRKLVWILVTMATFSLVANLLAGRLTPNPPDPRLDDLNLNPAQKAQVQEVLEQVQIRAGERDRQGRQRFARARPGSPAPSAASRARPGSPAPSAAARARPGSPAPASSARARPGPSPAT